MTIYKNCIAVIGDIHGCIKELSELYNILSDFNIPLYSVGDFVDRGKNSKEVVDFLIDKNIKAVLGNHEAWFLEAMNGEDDITKFKDWVSVGGAQTVISYFDNVQDVTIKGFRDKITLLGHFKFISSLPLKFEINNLIISHAGKIKDGSDSSLYYNYGNPEKLKEKFQIFGHKPKTEVEYQKGWYANIDTGCVFGNKLTAIVIDSITTEIVEIIQINSKTINQRNI